MEAEWKALCHKASPPEPPEHVLLEGDPSTSAVVVQSTKEK